MPTQRRKSLHPTAHSKQTPAAPTDWDSLPLVLTIPQVAHVLGIGRDSAYALARQPGFPVVDAGKRKLVSRDALKRWLEQAETRHATPARYP